jgi:tetratricopeptide (TPR) repeat protein
MSKRVVLCGSLTFLLAASAPEGAPTPDTLARLQFLVASGQPGRAAARSAQLLTTHPDHAELLAVHAVAISALGEAPAFLRTLEPESGPGARAAYTAAVVSGLSAPEPSCDAVDRAIEAAETPEEWRAYQYLHERVVAACPEHAGQAFARLAQAVSRTESEHASAIGLSLGLAEADATWGEQFVAWARSSPVDLTAAGNPWHPEAKGLGLVAARVALAAEAERAAQTDDPARLWFARSVFRWQGLDTTALDLRLQEVAPGAREAGWQTRGAVRWHDLPAVGDPSLAYRLHEAAGIESPERRKRALAGVGAELPITGVLRADWWTEMADVHNASGRSRAEVRALESAWRADPTQGERANAFAWAAATHTIRMDAALEAINDALLAPASYDASRGGPAADGDFRWNQGHQVGAWLDTRGWLRFQMGDVAGARADFDRALMLYRSASATVHFHAGLAADADGDVEAALFHLREGFAVVDARYDEPELVADARTLVASLYASHRFHPGGLDAWLAGRQRSEGPSAEPGNIVDLERVADHLSSAPASLPVQGRPLPELLIDVGGSPKALAEVGGWRVVELWAAWCVSCHVQIGAMLELHRELQAAGIPVTVVVVSVEDEVRTSWPTQMVGTRDDHWLMGWAGPRAMDRIGAAGLPATLVVDPSGQVVDSRMGWEGNLDWLRATLTDHGVWAPPSDNGP